MIHASYDCFGGRASYTCNHQGHQIGFSLPPGGWHYLTQSTRGYSNPGGRMQIADPWEAPRGVSPDYDSNPGVQGCSKMLTDCVQGSGFFFTSRSEMLRMIAGANAVYQSLLGDINTLVRKGSPDAMTNVKILVLQGEYATFMARWTGWSKEEEDSIFVDSSAFDVAMSDFHNEYVQFRTRYVDLGGTPSVKDTALPVNNPLGLPQLPSWAIPVLVIGAIIYFVSPILLPILAGRALAR